MGSPRASATESDAADEGAADACPLVFGMDGEGREHADPPLAVVVADDRMADHHVPHDLASDFRYEGHLGDGLG